ncbi:MAG TPA: hypothetical protein DD640_02650 [Clostridiales bacterium]|nr:hypothetical protein [Clostridiales bacterium]
MEQKDGFIPVGFQYYRAPTPRAECWEADLRKISRDGFNTVKYWVQWRWNVPAQGEYFFADIDRLMDLAQENKLKVILNVIFDVAPAWFIQDHPDSLMITNNHEVITPRALDCRQIGGAPGPCFHHGQARAYKREFLAGTVKRYASHPALYCWDLWNEPELTTGVKRQLSAENLVCYCDNSRHEFIKWLQSKYIDIDCLNKSWQRNYRGWDQIEIPVNHSTFNDMIDWRLFFIDTVTEELRDRVRTAREFDPNHPMMCHTVPLPIFNSITCASDDWALAKECDMFGNSIGSHPLPANILTSAARGKKVINSEIHAAAGNTMTPHLRPSLNDMLRHIFVPLAKGIEGFIFWQYRPEILGLEAPAWGSVDREGKDTDWHLHLKMINSFLKSEADTLRNRKRKTAKIGLYLDPKNEIFIWIGKRSLDLYHASLIGAYHIFHDLNFDVVFIREEDLAGEWIQGLSVLYMPPQFYFNARSAQALKEWVRQGGLIISEPFLGSVQEENGLYSEVIPGYGLDEVFGVRQTGVVSEEMMLSGDPCESKGEASHECLLIHCGPAAQDVLAGSQYQVSHQVIHSGVEVAGTFADGSAALFVNRFGQGQAILLGSLLGYSYHREKQVEITNFIKNALREQGITNDQWDTVPIGIRVDTIEHENEGIIILNNTSDKDLCAVIKNTFSEIYPVFDDESEMEKIGENLKLNLKRGRIGIFKYKYNFATPLGG